KFNSSLFNFKGIILHTFWLKSHDSLQFDTCFYYRNLLFVKELIGFSAAAIYMFYGFTAYRVFQSSFEKD
ncbi:MAG: hypothetical protein J7K40_15070, partial [candidate division Zixibacteria bacterium]|nr:hypothetical protein [candidate division Zixibacteria bacterium]